MIYLDSAANTPVDPKVLDAYVSATKKYIANPNSSHKLGVDAKKVIDTCSKKIAKFFNCSKEGVIYTSGSSESNNLIIKGIAEARKDKGNKIIISALEHSSIVAPCNYLASLGFDVSVIDINKDGVVDLKELEKELDDNTILVSIAAVDSELGTIQPISDIAKLVKKYKNCVFHTDATQAIGKVDIDYSDVDFITFAPHKFYGLNGSGVLINRNNLKLIPLIHGGKSTTVFRSGTPVTANVVAIEKAFTLAIKQLSKRYKYVSSLNKELRDYFSTKDYIHINSPINSIPNTINISLINKNTRSILKKLEKNGVYLSTTTACSLEGTPSKSVLAITGDKDLAANTIRISVAYYTSIKDIKRFERIFDSIIKK